MSSKQKFQFHLITTGLLLAFFFSIVTRISSTVRTPIPSAIHVFIRMFDPVTYLK